MLESCLAGFLNTNRKPCSEFPIICEESMLFLHIYRKKQVLMSKYYQSKCVTLIVKVVLTLICLWNSFKSGVVCFFFFGDLWIWSWIDYKFIYVICKKLCLPVHWGHKHGTLSSSSAQHGVWECASTVWMRCEERESRFRNWRTSYDEKVPEVWERDLSEHLPGAGGIFYA